MNIPAAITLSCLSLGFGGTAAYFALGPGPEAAAAGPATTAPSRDGTSDRLDAIERSIEELGREIASQTVPAAARVANDAIDDERLAAAIAAYFEQNAEVAPAETEDAAADPLGFETAEEALALLDTLSVEDSQAIWKRLIELGLDEEVLALAQAAAEAAPHDPEAQLALGNAYIGRLQQSSGAETGKFATLADKAFDAALAADPEHWEARFTKAVSLSFWPPIFGKQNQAISQFETLVQQQAGATPSSEHAQTHLMLGNMYQQTGQLDKAIAAWNAGLELFPDDEGLRSQLTLAQSGR